MSELLSLFSSLSLSGACVCVSVCVRVCVRDSMCLTVELFQ